MLTSESKNAQAYVYAFYVVLSLAVYARAFDNPFRQDDFTFLRHVETTDLRDAFKPAPHFAFYRPGAIALFSLEYRLFGRNGGAYILFNYAVHFVNSILLLLILPRIDPHQEKAFLASGLFLSGFGHYGKQVMWASASGPLASVSLSLASVLITCQWLTFQRTRNDRGPVIGGVLYPTTAIILLSVSPLFHEASLVTAVLTAFIARATTRHP